MLQFHAVNIAPQNTRVGGIAYIVGCVFLKDIVTQFCFAHKSIMTSQMTPTPTKSYPVGSMGIFHCGFNWF